MVHVSRVQTHRSIVHQCDIHHRSKDAVFDFVLAKLVLYLLEEMLIQCPSFLAACRLVEIWLVTFFCGSKQRKLRDCCISRVELKPIDNYSPHKTSPSISFTFSFQRPTGSVELSSQSLVFKIFEAIDSMSFSVSSLDTAASTNMPFPIDEMSWPSTVTDADLTLCSTAVQSQWLGPVWLAVDTYSS